MGNQSDQVSTEAYEAPELRVLGSVEELTLATQFGENLDGDFLAGTPLNDLTTS
jgi:hypothetical protein